MLTITIKTENAAFEEPGKAAEVARILRKYADQIEGDGDVGEWALADYNGNRVGFASVDGEDEDD